MVPAGPGTSQENPTGLGLAGAGVVYLTWRLSVAGLGVLVAALPIFVSNPYYLNILAIVGLNALMVIGLNLLIGLAGQISLGHAAFFGLGAYLTGLLSTLAGLSPWLSLPLSLILTMAVAWVIGRPTLKLHGNYLVMATLGFNLIVHIVLVQWDSLTGGPSGLPGIPTLRLGGFAFDTDLKWYFLIWGVTIVGLILALNLVDSRVGRGLRALAASELAAGCLGVDAARYKVAVFVLSAGYSGLAGGLYALYLTFISPATFDIFFSVELVTMVIVGGMGSVWGSLIGALVLTPLPHLLGFVQDYKDLIYGAVLLVILIFYPQGIFVLLRDKAAGLRSRKRP